MIRPHSKICALIVLAVAVIGLSLSAAHARATIDYPIVKLRSLDKITARTQVFEAQVGRTIKFGGVYIKVQACRKAPELEQPESAAFLQVWEVPAEEDITEPKAEWIFSGWMFASSPGLSAMDHPIYDVWVLDCLQTQAEIEAAEKAAAEAAAKASEKAEEQQKAFENILEGEGVLDERQAPETPAMIDQ